MFVMISPLQAHLGESLTSLKFATKVKIILSLSLSLSPSLLSLFVPPFLIFLPKGKEFRPLISYAVLAEWTESFRFIIPILEPPDDKLDLDLLIFSFFSFLRLGVIFSSFHAGFIGSM